MRPRQRIFAVALLVLVAVLLPAAEDFGYAASPPDSIVAPYAASRALPAVFEYTVDVRNIAVSNVTPSVLRACFYGAADVAMGAPIGGPAGCITVPPRTQKRWEPLSAASVYNVRLFRSPFIVGCNSRKGVQAPSALNVTGTCSITHVPVRQTPPPSLRALGAYVWAGKYNAYDEELTFFVAQAPDYLYIGIRGTVTAANGAMNMNGVPVPFPISLSTAPLVHTGWSVVVGKAHPMIKALIDRWRGSRRLLITGHSMGGAVAGYLTMRLLLDGVRAPILVTFGAPRYATDAFALEFDRRLRGAGGAAYSVEVENDKKLPMWQDELAKRMVRLNVLRNGVAVDYKIGELSNPPGDEHYYKTYFQIAEQRWRRAGSPPP